MTVTAPPVVVPAPVVTPSRYGLLTAASTLTPIADPHIRNGIEWMANPFGAAHNDPADCSTPSDRTDVPDGIPVDQAGPIVLYAGWTGRALGLTEGEILGRATDALSNGESAGVERAVWSVASLRLMHDGVTTDLTDGTAVSLVTGLGMLEDELAGNYGGLGVIHVPRGVASAIALSQNLDDDGAGHKITPLGTRFAFGAYPYTGPDGTAADAGTAWLVATGAIYIQRSQIVSRPMNLSQALNRSTNQLLALAERTYVVSWEAVTAAVLVNLP